MKTFKEISYLRKETSFKDHGYMFFSNIEQKPMIMVTHLLGNSSKGLCQGEGTYTWTDGRVYVGQW